MASGRLAVTLRDPASSVLWFRPEVVRTVTWAGDPTRKEAGGAASLHPRHSSSAWKQVVRARAEPWRAAEVDTAEALRRHIIELNLGKQVAVAEQAVRMRDEMVAVLSHDLKSPLQVIRMSNAIKYTPARGVVTIFVHGDASMQNVTFEVRDTGPGIAALELSNIFDRYWQARHASSIGAGLGLYIAKGIVEAHGGRIWADSAPKQGATFSFTLPASGELA